jgi:aryl-alcohol dehydrogenase
MGGAEFARKCEAIESLMPGGTCVLLGSARRGSEVSVEMPFLQDGRILRGVVQGESMPKEFIPRLVDLIMENKFPIQKMIKFYDFADINLAAQESSAGIAIKPVLRMPAIAG